MGVQLAKVPVRFADCQHVPGASRSDSVGSPGAFPALAAVLWTVHEALEDVLYRLLQFRLVARDGASMRWLPRADHELRRALEALESAEVLRAAEVEGIAGLAHGHPSVPETVTLASLQELARDPWPAVLAEHGRTLRALVREVEKSATQTRRVLQAASAPARVRAGGRVRFESDAPDEARGPVITAVFESATATLTRLPQLSLREFLG